MLLTDDKNQQMSINFDQDTKQSRIIIIHNENSIKKKYDV